MPQRHLKTWSGAILAILLLSSLQGAFAKDVTVFDVRRALAMENGDQPHKDYFFNAGSSEGLKKGMLVTVTRRQALYDQYLNKSPGDLVVAVGVLRIIHIQADMSVARLESLQNRDNSPGVEFEAIMVGDKVEISSARMAPQKTASLDNTTPSSSPTVEQPQLPSDNAKSTTSAVEQFLIAPKASANVNTAM